MSPAFLSVPLLSTHPLLRLCSLYTFTPAFPLTRRERFARRDFDTCLTLHQGAGFREGGTGLLFPHRFSHLKYNCSRLGRHFWGVFLGAPLAGVETRSL